MPINNNNLSTPECLREAGAGSSHRGGKRRQTHAVRPAGPSGEAASPSSQPDQLFFIELVSYCPSGSSHFSMGVALPEFCLTSVSGKCPALTNINLCNVYVLACQMHEHCLGSAGPANLRQSVNNSLNRLRRPVAEYGSGRYETCCMRSTKTRRIACNIIDSPHTGWPSGLNCIGE